MPQDVFVRPDRAAQILHLSVSSLAKMRVRGDGPAYTKSGHKLVLYREADLVAWLTARMRSSTSEQVLL
jgi:hypothetical protein